jgi:hypothetical protein
MVTILSLRTRLDPDQFPNKVTGLTPFQLLGHHPPLHQIFARDLMAADLALPRSLPAVETQIVHLPPSHRSSDQ